MNERRFTEIISIQKVIDNQTGKEYDCWIDDDLLELLNELAKERDYFERKKEYFLSKWSIAHAKNIQLRQQNKELEGKVSSWKITASEEILKQEDLIKQIVELKEEREIAIDGIKIADELIKKYGSDELKLKWKKEVTVKYR